VAVCLVPVHFICSCDSSQCEIVHGGHRQQHRDWCPSRNSGCQAPTQERLVLSSAVPWLGGSCWRCSGSPCNCTAHPANTSVFIHLHYHCVLPLADQAIYHVPVHATYTGRPPTASFGRQVSLEKVFSQFKQEKSKCLHCEWKSVKQRNGQ